MNLTICRIGKVSDSFAQKMSQEAQKITYDVANANVSATLHRAKDLPDVAEFKHLSPDKEVARIVLTQPGYLISKAGVAVLENPSNLKEALSTAYKEFLKNVSNGTWVK